MEYLSKFQELYELLSTRVIFETVAAGCFFLGGFYCVIRSVYLARKDEYSKATYLLIVSLVCAFCVRAIFSNIIETVIYLD